MSRRLEVDLFVEDKAHEELIRPIVERIAVEEGLAIRVQVRSALGGHGRAITEFELYQLSMEKSGLGKPIPDLVVVGIDGNCASFTRKREEIEHATRDVLRDRVVPACPDPHVERWYLVDPVSFAQVVGHHPKVGKQKCKRDHYKKLLAEAVRAAGHPPTLGGLEFAREIANALDWYRSERADRSFKAFVDDLRLSFRRLGGSSDGPIP